MKIFRVYSIKQTHLVKIDQELIKMKNQSASDHVDRKNQQQQNLDLSEQNKRKMTECVDYAVCTDHEFK